MLRAVSVLVLCTGTHGSPADRERKQWDPNLMGTMDSVYNEDNCLLKGVKYSAISSLSLISPRRGCPAIRRTLTYLRLISGVVTCVRACVLCVCVCVCATPTNKTFGPTPLDVKTGKSLSCHSKWVDLDGCLAAAASVNTTTGMVPIGTRCEAECMTAGSSTSPQRATFECRGGGEMKVNSKGRITTRAAGWRGTLKCPQAKEDDLANDGASMFKPKEGTTWRYPRK